MKVYVGDTGTIIVLDCGEDISSAISRTIQARKPSGQVVSWNATASGTNSISFTSQQGTFDQAGTWKLQAVIITPNGTWKGETVAVQVYPSFT